MTRHERFQILAVNRGFVKKLRHSGLVFRTPGLEHDRQQVFRPEHPGRGPPIAPRPRLLDGLFDKRVVRRDELHRHPANEEMFPLNAAPLLAQVVVDRGERHQPSSTTNTSRS